MEMKTQIQVQTRHRRYVITLCRPNVPPKKRLLAAYCAVFSCRVLLEKCCLKSQAVSGGQIVGQALGDGRQQLLCQSLFLYLRFHFHFLFDVLV